MKSLLFGFLVMSSVVLAQLEEDLVKEVVNSAYVSGIHNGGSIESIRKGFHPSFQMLRLVDNEIKSTTIEEWITGIEKSRAQGNATPATRTDARFMSVTIAGTSANVVLELWRGDKKIFTDNLLLYKFNEGWRIVSKTFYRHP